MNKYVALILGSALTALIAGTALAASATPSVVSEAKPAAPAPATTSAAPAVAAPAPVLAAPAVTVLPDTAAAAKEPVKIGYVDMAQIAAETDSGKAAAATLKTKSQKLGARIEAKQKQLEKQKEAIQAKIATLSPKEREAKSKEFQKKVEEYQKLVRTSDKEMQALQEKLTSDIYAAIKKAATAYGKSHGFAAVLAKKDLLYMADIPEPKDLTEELTEILNKNTPAK
jgi:outer membrane protein